MGIDRMFAIFLFILAKLTQIKMKNYIIRNGHYRQSFDISANDILIKIYPIRIRGDCFMAFIAQRSVSDI